MGAGILRSPHLRFNLSIDPVRDFYLKLDPLHNSSLSDNETYSVF